MIVMLKEKEYYPGLDLLKFILAILIVSGHCRLFEEFPTIYQWWGHIDAVAVPLFFAISSFLFFRKVYSMPLEEDTNRVLYKSIKRLAILFVIWYVLMLPMTYFKFFSVATLKETIFAIFFSCCFNGYWFIKALLINTVIVFYFRRKNSLVICTIIAAALYFYCSFNYIFHYNSYIVSLRPYYSFFYHLLPFCLGAWLAKIRDYKIPNIAFILMWIMALLLCHYKWMDPVYRIVSVLFIFPVFARMRIEHLSPSTLKNLRYTSTILYMVQFFLIWIYDGAGISQLSLVRFVVVLSLALLFSYLIIYSSSRHKWLRYLY